MVSIIQQISEAIKPTSAVVLTSLDTTKIPLGEAVEGMDPQDVWQDFYNLTQIPRPSHYEQQVGQYLAEFGRSLGLETTVDDVGNVLIRKPAAKGMEDRHSVVLQAHMDMVPQQAPDKDFDFTKPQLWISRDFLCCQ